MNEFNELFNLPQRFLMLQAYIDSQLTEEELMNFMLLETNDQVPIVFYAQGILIIEPSIDLNQFSHRFYPFDQLSYQKEKNDVILSSGKKTFRFSFESEAETQKILNDLNFLYESTGQ